VVGTGHHAAAGLVISITTSSVNTSRMASQSLVSIVRKYRALSCLIASMSSTALALDRSRLLDVSQDDPATAVMTAE
jgi:hypothetical protein